jgi:hypothetical protein
MPLETAELDRIATCISPGVFTHEWLEAATRFAILPLVIASISWTVTHEEIFREPREYCLRRAHGQERIAVRKFFYVFTCEYCFSHYVTAAVVALTRERVLFDDWRGFAIAFFGLNAVANLYMALFARLRVEIKVDRLEIAEKTTDIAEKAGARGLAPSGEKMHNQTESI